MPTPSHITKPQRDRLLAKADRHQDYCADRKWSRRAGAATPADELRLKKVARRLRRFVAGVGRDGCTKLLTERATERHIAGITGYGEWIEELRWAGLSAHAGYTYLSPKQKAARQESLNRIEGLRPERMAL